MKKSKPFIFNPAEETKDSLIQNFVIRLDAFKTIIKSIRSSSPDVAPEHFLIIGQRGMGKTTLLLRIKYQIQDEPELHSFLIPIKFSEEQYQISNLINLWEETAISLAAIDKQYKNLPEQMLQHEREDDYEQICFSLLTTALKKEKKRVVLLIDNVGNLFDKFSDLEARQFRATLMTSPHILLIGGSAQVLEHTFSYDKPFFEFFHQIRLEPLQKEDTIKLMSTLAEQYGVSGKIDSIIQTNPERIEVLRRITGGVPRTMVLLFEILANSANGAAFEDLEELTDRVSPLYTSRMDSLKPQQQKIIDTLARAWEPISAKDLLEQSRLYREGMQSNQISSQLKQLEDNQIVEVIDSEGRKKLYRIRERFFNIWYLMRHGRKSVREQVEWLVRFLEAWCTVQELHQIASNQISCLEEGHYYEKGAYYKAIALHSISSLDRNTKKHLLETTEKFLRKENRNDWAMDIHNLSNDLENDSYTKKSFQAFENGDIESAERYILKAFESNEKDSSYILGEFYDNIKSDKEKAEYYYLKAVEENNSKAIVNLAMLYEGLGRLEKAEGLYLRGIRLEDDISMNNLALLYEKQKKIKRAKELYLKAIKYNNDIAAYNLATVYSQEENLDKAEEFYLKAIEFNENNNNALYNLATQYYKQGRLVEAEKYYLLSVKQNDKDAMNNVAVLYEKQNKIDEAEKLYLKAVKLNNSDAMFNLALLYEKQNKIDKAEKLYLKAIEENNYNGIDNLAHLYYQQNKSDKAEEYFLKAIEQNNRSSSLFNLATLYHQQKKFDKAEKYYLEAIKQNNNKAMFNLAMLYNDLDKNDEAEKYFRKAMDHNLIGAANNLALLYKKQKRFNEAEELWLSNIKNETFYPPVLYNLVFHFFSLNNPKEALHEADQLLSNDESYQHIERMIDIVELLIVKQQYNFLLNKFQQPDSLLNKYLRPYYYVLAFFIKDKLPGVYEQAGAEIKETVDEMIKQIQSQIPKKETKKKKAKT